MSRMEACDWVSLVVSQSDLRSKELSTGSEGEDLAARYSQQPLLSPATLRSIVLRRLCHEPRLPILRALEQTTRVRGVTAAGVIGCCSRGEEKSIVGRPTYLNTVKTESPTGQKHRCLFVMAEFIRAQIFGTTFEITSRYTDLQPVGMGAFGLVCSAKDQLAGQAVAVKKIMKPFSTPVLAKRTYRELKLLKHLRHENVGLCGCRRTSQREVCLADTSFMYRLLA